ncbi:amidohydrolase family protein [Lentiprolixibacter aurantiacus]|uniref:Amidohydrolase family protein n=1 Tax=Lentiprolixibacter aurantiacus TaxID=2993939 RepID=A0AAE3MM10_9FLAO|nr:amidohydrolase family protein [Lentiprolixibacter aurantiacus]MCX2720260.1 amidohydrolase family protein [Lentiprolixibacter aurantiacus]
MRILIPFRYLAFLLLLLTTCKSEQLEEYDLVLTAAEVIDLESGEINTRNVFISDGLIKRVLPVGSSVRYRTQNSIPANGKYLLPGFWDNHVHFRGGEALIEQNKAFLKLFLANGITTVRDAGGDLTTYIKQWQKEIANGMPGPKIFTSGPKIDGPGATWAGSLEVTEDEDIPVALDSLESLGVDFVKLYDSRISARHYLETLRQTEERELISSGHMPFSVSLQETVEAGIDAIEHLYYVMKGCSSTETRITQAVIDGNMGFWQAMPELQQTYTDSIAYQTFTMLREKQVYVVPTLHIGRTLSYLDEADHSEDPYLHYLSPEFLETYKRRISSFLSGTDQARKNRKELDDFFRQLTTELHNAGVGLLAGSDCGAYNSYIYPGPSLHDELQALVSCGLSELEALRTSAYNGAHFLKKQTEYGTVSPGKKADLVILSANPLDNIQNTRKIEAVVREGKIYLQEDLKTLLEPN